MIARRVRVAAAVVRDDAGRLLLTRRPPGGALGLRWELPGGKIEPGETPEHAVVREVREELNAGATPGEVLAVRCYDYAHGLEVEITFLACTLDTHTFTLDPDAVHEVDWKRPEEIDLEGVLDADRDFLRALGARG